MLVRIFKTLAILIIITAGSFVVINGTPWAILEAQQDSIEYLENKYNEQFIVQRPSFFLLADSFTANAYPVRAPEIQFTVGTVEGEQGIQDNYALYLQEHEWELLAKEILKSYYKASRINVFAASESEKFVITINQDVVEVEAENQTLFEALRLIIEKDFPLAAIKVNSRDKVFYLSEEHANQLEHAEDLITYWQGRF